MVYSACLFVFYNVYLSQVDLNFKCGTQFLPTVIQYIWSIHYLVSACNHQAQIKDDWLKMSFLHILFDVQCFTVVCYLQNYLKVQSKECQAFYCSKS